MPDKNTFDKKESVLQCACSFYKHVLVSLLVQVKNKVSVYLFGLKPRNLTSYMHDI